MISPAIMSNPSATFSDRNSLNGGSYFNDLRYNGVINASSD